MNGPQILEEHVGKLITRMGAFFPGERVVFRGEDYSTHSRIWTGWNFICSVSPVITILRNR